jgi:hypothetical protein
MMSDDRFRHFSRGDQGGDITDVLDHWAQFIDDIVTPLNLKYLVLGLEALEYWTEEQCAYLGTWLKAACPNVKLCFHTLAGDVRLLEEDWVDIIAFQQEINKPAQELQDNIRILIAQYKKPVIAAEYHRSGETEEARLLGDDALAAGAVGAWNGCHVTGRATL